MHQICKRGDEGLPTSPLSLHVQSVEKRLFSFWFCSASYRVAVQICSVLSPVPGETRSFDLQKKWGTFVATVAVKIWICPPGKIAILLEKVGQLMSPAVQAFSLSRLLRLYFMCLGAPCMVAIEPIRSCPALNALKDQVFPGLASSLCTG